MNNILQTIRENAVYKQILKDSFGGVMYNVANRGTYDTAELLRLWNSLSISDKSSVDGIMKGAFNFIQEVEA